MSPGGFGLFGWKSRKPRGANCIGRHAKRSGSYARYRRLALEPLEDRTLLSVVNWVSPTGGDWDTASNWLDVQGVARLPGPGDDVVINLPGITVTHDRATADAIHSLTSSDPIIFSAGALALAAASTIGNDLTLSGGSITGPGDLTVAGLLAWSGGAMSGTGAITVQGPLVMGAANAGNQSETLDQRTLIIAGPASYLGAGTFATSDGAAVLKNPADIAFNAPTAPGSYVAYRDAIVNGLDPGIAANHYPDNNLQSVVSTSPTQTITWSFNDNAPSGATIGSLATIAEQNNYQDGSTSKYLWTYAGGTLASVSENNTYSFGSSSFTWSYNADGSLASASQQDSYPGNSSDSLAWTYNGNPTPLSVTQTTTDPNGATTIKWTNNADNSPALIAQTATNADGSLASTATWTYSNGILNSVTQHVNNSDGTSTDSAWYNNADGSLVTCNWTNYANGSSASVSRQVYNAAGILVNSYQWSFYADASLNSYTEYDYTTDGSQVDNAALSPYSPTTVTSFHTISYNSDGTLASLVLADLKSDGTSTYESYNQPVPGSTPAIATVRDYHADGSLADLTQWYYWQTFGSRVSNGGTDIVQTDYNADGSYASYTWSYRPNGALAYFTEISYGASGTLLTSNLWEYFPDGPLFQWSTDAYGYGQGWENDEAAGVILLTTFTPSGGANWFYSNGTLDTYRQLDSAENVIEEWSLFANYGQGGWDLGLPADAPPPAGADFGPAPLAGFTLPVPPSASDIPVPKAPSAANIGATSPPSVNRSADTSLPSPLQASSAPQPSLAPRPPDLVEVCSLSTTDSREVTVVYDVIGPDLTQSFDIGIFRSSTATFGSGINVKVGSISETANGAFMTASDGTPVGATPASGNFLSAGLHAETLPLSNSTATYANLGIALAAPLAPDPQLSYVIAAAYPDGNLPDNVTTDDTDAHFHIYIITGVEQGFGLDQAWVDSANGWNYGPNPQTHLLSFTAMLAAEGFASEGNVVLPDVGHWNSLTTDPAETPQGPVPQSVAAGDNLYISIAAHAQSMLLTYPLQKNDVIDVDLIGHSRGSVVIDQAFGDLLAAPTAQIPAQLQHGYYKMTMLDPHPANTDTVDDASFVSGFSLNPLKWLPGRLIDNDLSGEYDDPAIVVPPRINQVEDYYQKTPIADLVPWHYGFESLVNLQGLSLYEPLPNGTEKITVVDQTQTITTEFDLNSIGLMLGHSEIYGWYEETVMPSLGTAAPVNLSGPWSSVGSGPAMQLSIVPSSIMPIGPDGNLDPVSGAPFTLDVLALNAQGNPDPAFNGSVTVALATNPGSCALGGTLTVNAVNGVAAFSDLTITNPGSGYTFAATAKGLTSATSVPIDVEPYQLVLTSPPPDSVAAGSGFALAVTAKDGAGNVDASFNGNVTVALGDYFGGTAPLGGTATAQAHQGVAAFSGLTIGAAGDYLLTASGDGLTGTSSPISATAAAASQLVVSSQPASSVTAGSGFDLVVSAEDVEGNVDPTFNGNVTLALGTNPGGGDLGGTLTEPAINGIADFPGLTIDTAGNGYTLEAASTGLAATTSNPLDITAPGVATHLVVIAEPPSAVTAESGFALTVAAEDDFGAVDASFRGNVTLAVEDGASNSGTLGGTLSVPAVAGVAAFSGLTLSTADNNYILQASSAALGAGLTAAFDVTPPGVATEMVLTTQPPCSVAAGSSFGLVVSAEDGFGTVNASFNGSVSVALPSGSVATLGGTLTVQAVNGVATFSNLTLDQSGSYELSVAEPGLPAVTTDSITVGSPFAGAYTGTMTGTASGPNGTEPVSNNLSFSVSGDGAVFLVDPGSGVGTVAQGGAITGFGTFAGLSFSFTGTAVLSSTGALGASGNWTFSDGSGSGTWSATANSAAPVTPTISWSTPAAVVYGTPLSINQLDASASVPGTFSYLPASGSVLVPGKNQTLTVTFTPTDTTHYTAATATVSINVTPAPLMIMADNQTMPYGGPLPTLTVSYAGFVNGDTAASLSTPPTVTTTATAASHASASPYLITASGAVDPDYSIAYVVGALTVTPAPLTITAANETMPYGGPLPTLAAGYTGFVNGDTPASLTTPPTLTTTATAASHASASPYPITASGAVDPDYTISYVAGTLTVTSATVTAVSSQASGTYGAGTTIPITLTFSGPVTVTGLPQLALNAGAPGTPGRGAVANYTSGGGTSTLTFTYIVAAGQTTSDLDYSSTGALTLNGGTIESAGSAVSLTLPATGTDGLATRDIAVGPFSEGFENGNFKTWPWQLSSAGTSPANWTVQSSVVHAGSCAAQSGPIGASSSSTLSVTLTEAAGGEFSFWRSVSSASASGILTFAIDGATANQWSGTVPWQQSFYCVSAGTHTFSWSYSKGTGAPAGSDAAWLDDVLFTPGTTLTVDGTSASDQFGFATSGPTVIVALDGETHSFAPGEFTNYVFHGDGGTAILIGGTGTNSAMLYANGSGQLNNSMAGYAVAVDGVTSITAIGHAGDTAQFFDSPGNDAFYAYGDFNQSGQPLAEMVGAGYASVASGFGTNIGNSSGNDSAVFFDSPGNDAYDAYADFNNSGQPAASMSGSYGVPGTPGRTSYSNTANGFGANVAYATNGGTDTAQFFGSPGAPGTPGRDSFFAYTDYLGQPVAFMSGSYGGTSYSNAASGFGSNAASTTGGGSDTAVFFDATGNATFSAYTDANQSGQPEASMSATYGGASYSDTATGFSTNLGYATNGGNDAATFYDATGKATYFAYADYNPGGQPLAVMYGSGYFNVASGFRTSAGYATPGGNDTAVFVDSPGNDTYDAYADYNNSGQPWAEMSGSYGSFGQYSNTASGFGANLAFSTSGGNDTANFFDSAGNATFYAYADVNQSGQSAAGMYGSYAGFGAYSNSANGFGTNVGTSTNAGNDTADLFGPSDSGSSNALYTDAAIAQLYGTENGNSYAEEASGFPFVSAVAQGGTNTRTSGPDPLKYQLNPLGDWLGGG